MEVTADGKKDSGRVDLWPEGAPGALGDGPKDRPYFTVHLPDASKSRSRGGLPPAGAVVICPGGGYGSLADRHEGIDCAALLNSLGVAAFVLRYRVAPYRHPAPLTDAQRAIRIVRSRAAEWNVDPGRVGIWGFSAGGHLASTAATHFDSGDPAAADPVERCSCRPDFLILGYPVVTLRPPYAHLGSRKNLIGEDADEKLVEFLSNDEQVTADTPPTFLFHTDEDAGVPSENSVLFYLALRRAGVPAELHIFLKGRHGLGLAPDDPVLSKWPGLLACWLRTIGV